VRKDGAAPVARRDAVWEGFPATASVAILPATPRAACAVPIGTRYNHAL
jgi:hypothetical protein